MASTNNSIIISNTSKTKDRFTSNPITDSFSLDQNHFSTHQISLIQDSSSDLQWCTEVDYQYKSDESTSYSRRAPTSIFEGSLLGSSNSYATPPTSNYVNISNNFDANLAEIDMETFRSEDINTVFLQAGEDCASLSRSIFEDSVSLSSFDRSTGYSHGEQEAFSSKEFETCAKNKENSNRENHDQLEGKMAPNDISVDSLDMSFENNTSELLMKCTEQDKKKYTIAFEGSINASQEFLDLNQQKRLSHLNKSSSSQLNYMANQANNQKMIKSEYLNSSRDQVNRNVNCKANQIISDIDSSISKLSQSIPNLKSLVRVTGDCRIPYCPVSGFMPLYDLQSSQSSNSHTSSSEFSPPRSLVRMFMQNKTSPLSSGQISPSLSYESHSQESASGNTSDSSSKPNYYNNLEITRETNNNNPFLENVISRTGLTDEVVSYEDNCCKNRYRYDSQKLPYSLKQTFPIKEVDETMTDSSNTDINMSSIDGFELNTHLSDLNRNDLQTHQFVHKPNDVSDGSNMSSKLHQKYSNTSNHNPFRTNISTNSKEGSSTSGNSRLGFEHQNATNDNRSKHHKYTPMTNTRTTSTQFPIHIRDKEVQASLTSKDSLRLIMKEEPNAEQTHGQAMTSESPNESKRPFYVYYPNYSLPDLSFLEEILEVHSDNTPQTVFLSPTKHQLPSKDSVSVKMRQTAKPKCRPKSYTDYETLSKQNFSHIKDWDSLNILLPNEFKALIQKAQNASVSKTGMNINSENKNDSTYKDYDFRSSNNVRMRSHKSNVQLADNSGHYGNRGNSRKKRYSLQEPYSAFNQQQSDCCNSSNNISCMSRSITMPNCRNVCHCHQHCYHNCCHSCCHTPCHSPSVSSAKPFPQTSFCDFNASSIDKLCQLLAMDLSFKKIMSVINGQNAVPNQPSCEPVPEEVKVKEEYILNNVNNNNGSVQKNNSVEDVSNKEGSNFKELKQHWESLATSPGSSTNTLACYSTKKESKASQPNKQTPKDSSNSCAKPAIAKKPQLVLRRPVSHIPRPTTLNTDSPVPSHRKSLIPVPKSAPTRSPTLSGTKIKSNNAFNKNVY